MNQEPNPFPIQDVDGQTIAFFSEGTHDAAAFLGAVKGLAEWEPKATEADQLRVGYQRMAARDWVVDGEVEGVWYEVVSEDDPAGKPMTVAYLAARVTETVETEGCTRCGQEPHPGDPCCWDCGDSGMPGGCPTCGMESPGIRLVGQDQQPMAGDAGTDWAK
jgi:hypothetical protein